MFNERYLKTSLNLSNPPRSGSGLPKIRSHDDDDNESLFMSSLFNNNKSVNDNKIYFYEEINPLTALMLNKQINEKSNDLMAVSFRYSIDPIPLYIHVNSPGGNIFDGLSIMDNVIASKIPIITIVEGVCASAATFFLIASKRRQIRKHSHIMIHELSSGHHGKFSESETHLQNLQNFMAIMKKLYKEKTKLPTKMINDLLKKDLFLDSKLALQYGFVDEIV